jgi:Resolvase, N terminal domain
MPNLATQQDEAQHVAEDSRTGVVYERVSDDRQDLARQAVQPEWARTDYPDTNPRVVAPAAVIPAIIYAAKSTADVHGSIQTQIEDCLAAIEREGQFLYAEPLVDEGFSAYKCNRGPRLAEAKRLAIEAAERHGDAHLWSQHSDRVARGDGLTADHLGQVYFEMRAAHVRLRSVQDDGKP